MKEIQERSVWGICLMYICKMLALERTDSENEHIRSLVKLLDAELAELDGDEHTFYAQYNKPDKIEHMVLATQNRQPVGCGALKKYADDCMEVKRMYVSESFRGSGIAVKILAELETWAKEEGFTSCILETGLKQQSAIKLYEKSGYKLIPNYGQYEGMANSVCMKKELALL